MASSSSLVLFPPPWSRWRRAFLFIFDFVPVDQCYGEGQIWLIGTMSIMK
jgi:hypothetical protein